MLAYLTNFAARQEERKLKKEDTVPVTIKRFYQNASRGNWNKRLLLEDLSDLEWKFKGMKRQWEEEWGAESDSEDEIILYTYLDELGWLQEAGVAGREFPVVSRFLAPFCEVEHECAVGNHLVEIEIRQHDMFLKDDDCDIEATF